MHALMLVTAASCIFFFLSAKLDSIEMINYVKYISDYRNIKIQGRKSTVGMSLVCMKSEW